MILVEAFRALELLLADVEHEALFLRVERQRAPGNREQLGTHAQEAAEREHGISDASRPDIEHDRFDLAKALACRVYDFVADQGCRIHDFRSGSGRSIELVVAWNDVRAATGAGRLGWRD